MRIVVLKAAACELRWKLTSSQSYFEFLLIDPPSKFTKDDILLFVSLLLRLNKRRKESAMKGFQYLSQKLYDKGGLYQEGCTKKTVASWSKCSDMWIAVAQKMLQKNEHLLANALFKEGLFYKGY